MTDARDYLRKWREGLPEQLREKLTPAACLRAVHGVEPGSWACPACSRTLQVTDYPTGSCPGCGRPLPRVCDRRDESGRNACTNLVEPLPWNDGQGWYEPGSGSRHGIVCDSCGAELDREQRRDRLEVVLPDKERDQLGAGYDRYPHRRELDAALARWVDAGCGRDSGRPWIVTYGEPGSGKTMALLYFASAAYTRGVVRSIAYVTEEQLLLAASLEWSDVPDEKIRSRELLRTCDAVELLVFDEAGAAKKLTDAQHRKYSGMLKRRADAGLPTLIAMNRGLDLEGRAMRWLDIRVDSRLDQIAEIVSCGGVDLRREQR